MSTKDKDVDVGNEHYLTAVYERQVYLYKLFFNSKSEAKGKPLALQWLSKESVPLVSKAA